MTAHGKVNKMVKTRVKREMKVYLLFRMYKSFARVAAETGMSKYRARALYKAAVKTRRQAILGGIRLG